MKTCKTCGQRRPLTAFSCAKKNADGLRCICKTCQNIQNRKYKHNWKKWNKTHYAKNKSYGISIRAIRSLGLKVALFVFDRANRRCEICNMEYYLTIHHKDGNGRHNQEKGLPTNDDPQNLQVLCRVCHGTIHSHQYWKNKRK